VLKVLGDNWIVSTRILGVGVTSLRQEIYGIIIDALENGELSRLRRCLNCWKFFVAEDLHLKFCTPKCMRVADGKAAPLRVREWRKRKKAKEQKEARERAERLAFKSFSNFLALALKKRHTRDEGHRMHPIMCDLGRGDPAQGWNVIREWEEKRRRGASIKEIWRELHPQTKNVFEAA